MAAHNVKRASARGEGRAFAHLLTPTKIFMSKVGGTDLPREDGTLAVRR